MKKIVCKTLVLTMLVTFCGNLFADFDGPGVLTPKTVDLWQMDTIVANATSTRLQGESGDNNLWLMLYDNTNSASPTLGTTIAGPTVDFGQAMSFADNSTCGDADKPNIWAKTRTGSAWGNWPYFKLEMWVKYNDLDGLQFVAMTDAWRVWTQGSTIRFTSYFSDGSNSGNRDINVAGYMGQWLYVTAEFDENGHQSLTVKSLDGTFDNSASADFSGKVLKNTNGYITLASENGARRSFNGALDCVHITRPDIVLDFEMPASDTVVGTYGLWHFDQESGGITPDDNSADNMARDYDLSLMTGAALVTPADYPADNADFGQCLELDGMGAYAVSQTVPMIDTSLFNMEFWLKANPGIIPGENQVLTGALWLFAANNAVKMYLQISDTNIQLRFYADSTNNLAYTYIATDGNWHHYKFTFDNGAMTIHEDGIPKASITAAVTSLPDVTAKYFVGADGGARRYFWGWIDEMRIYGNTEAQCGDFGYLTSDINKDCYVGIADLEMMLEQWLKCTEEGVTGCDSLN
ncbi:MAG: LamG-like jellyroll fold domain-containing protein [Sedimentisphaeraceae bacterium JB056]